MFLSFSCKLKSINSQFPFYFEQSIFSGKDVILQAQTGSGKTLVYALPVLSKVDPSRAAIQAVIVVPSRELGLQVAGILKQLASASPKKIMVMSLVEGSQNRRWVAHRYVLIVDTDHRASEEEAETSMLHGV
jgi:superfamily II DNA or RNA helicase